MHYKWNGYANKIKKEGRILIFSTLTKRKPELKENFEVVFTIDSSAQQSSLDDEKPKLLLYLREQLNNYKITLTINMTKKDEKSMVYLSSRDVFLRMAEKNENLHILKEKLGLDLEY